MAKKKIPLSRIKYDKKNPTVSARVPKEKRSKLFAVLQKLSFSLSNYSLPSLRNTKSS